MIPPTVIIGVGGQGSSIALGVKQRLIEYAEERHNPAQERATIEKYVRTFAIDTKFESGIHDRFPAANVQILAPANANSSVKELIGPRARDDFFRDWWPSHIASPGNFLMGAGAMRAKGRLAYYLLGHGIAERVAAAINDLRNVRATEVGIQAGSGGDQPVYVIVAGSVSGGTGSGMLLTLAMHIRKRASGNVQMIGVIPMASVMALAPAKFLRQNVWANASAAMREIDWWLTPPPLRGSQIKPFFRLAGSGDEIAGDGSDGSDRPFDLCYLFTRNNRDGHNFSDHTEYTRLIADCLALDINSPVADKSQAMLSNFMARLVVQVRPPGKKNAKPVVYASAGAASLSYPVRNITQYLGLKMVGGILDQYFLSPSDLGPYAANWVVASRLEERGQYNHVHEDLRKPFEDPETRQAYKLPPKPNVRTMLEGAGRGSVGQVVRSARSQFDNSWSKTLEELADRNRQVLTVSHRSAIWSELASQLLTTGGDGFERAGEFARALRNVLIVNLGDVTDELYRSETGRRAVLERLESEYDRRGTKARGAIQDLEGAHRLLALPPRVRSARERFVGRWWNRYVENREGVITGEHVIRLYRDLLLWLDGVVASFDEVAATLREAREDLRREAIGLVGVRRPDSLVLDERILDDASLIEAHFKTSFEERVSSDSPASQAVARQLVGELTPSLETFANGPLQTTQRRRSQVLAAVNAALEVLRQTTARLFESEVAELSIWDALEQEYVLRRDLNHPDEFMSGIKAGRGSKRNLDDEVRRYIAARVKHCIATAKPFWHLDETGFNIYPEFTLTRDGLVSFSQQPFDAREDRATLRRELDDMAGAEQLSVHAADESPHRLIVTTRELGAPLFLLHRSERDELLSNERLWTEANGHVYLDQRYVDALPTDFDINLKKNPEDDALLLALAFHFGMLRFLPTSNGRNGRPIEALSGRGGNEWREYASDLEDAVRRLTKQPGERADFHEAIAQASSGISASDMRAQLLRARDWVTEQRAALSRSAGDDAQAGAFEAMERALDAELAGSR